MMPTRGVNHIALSVADMKRTLAFYTGTLGMRLVGLFPMHGVEGAVHAFLDMGDGRMLSFIQFREPRAGVEGLTHPGHPAKPSAATTMHHLAIDVADMARLEALRARLRDAGLRVSEPYDHGFCTSIYFRGPDGEQLELTCQTRALGTEELDRETVRAIGLSDAELADMTARR